MHRSSKTRRNSGLGGLGDEVRRASKLISSSSRRKSDSGASDLAEERSLIKQLQAAESAVKSKVTIDNDDCDNADSSNESFDDEEEHALSAAVTAGLSVSLELPSNLETSMKLKDLKKQQMILNVNADISPYIKGGIAQASAMIQKGRKGASSSISELETSKADNSVRQNRVIKTTSGRDWFDLPSAEVTDELKQDLRALRMRGALDPKRFYKSLDRPSKFIQLGTVIEGRDEFFTSRLTKKERRTNLVEELMADEKARHYTKRKFSSIQNEKQNKLRYGPKKRTKMPKHGKKESRKPSEGDF